MNIYIEFLVVGIALTMFFLWAIWKRITDWVILRRYKKEHE
jgi:hypothetical protein